MRAFFTTILVFLSLAVIVSSRYAHGMADSCSNEDHTRWTARVLQNVGTIHPGMTRKELMKEFTTEGGLSSRSRRTYVYRDCPYIKVDVEFRPAPGSSRSQDEHPDDTITSISRPYLQYSIMD